MIWRFIIGGLVEAASCPGVQLRIETCFVRCSGCRLPMYIPLFGSSTPLLLVVDRVVANLGTRVIRGNGHGVMSDDKPALQTHSGPLTIGYLV